jgi:hypothetical protein
MLMSLTLDTLLQKERKKNVHKKCAKTLSVNSYQSSFSGLAIIKLFLKFSNFKKMICLKCQKFKEFTREFFLKKWMKTQELHCNPPLESKYTIIDNISLSCNLAKHYDSPFLQ